MAYSIISVENLAELKTRRGNATNTTMATMLGLNYPTVEAFAVYVWDNLSTATPDDNQIIQPTVNGIPTGRWFKVDIGIDTALIIAALGYVPYDASNPLGFISSFIETDPIWTGVSANYRTKLQNDLLYESIFYKNTAFNKNFGTTSGTVAEGNDNRIVNAVPNTRTVNGQALSSNITITETNSDWNSTSGVSQILNKPALASVATSGSYVDLNNKPTIPPGQVNSDWNSASGVSQILNKPSLFSGAYVDLTGKPTIPIDNNQLTNGSGYITATSTNLLTNKSGNISQWTNDSSYLTSVPAQSFSSLTGKPTTITGYGITDFNLLGDARWSLLGHTHTFTSLTSKPTTLSGYAITDAYPLTGNPSSFLTSVTLGQVTTALGYTPVTNTRNLIINGVTQDLSSDRTWTVGDVTTANLTSGLATKENTISSSTTSQYWRGDKSWQTLDKTSVGLGNVDNISDLSKPISTATQTALNAKQSTLVSATNIKTINGSSLLGSGDLLVGNTYTAGAGISIASNVVTNTAPDQTVTLTAGNRISITGTYPNFTIGYVEPTINTPATRTLNSTFTVSTTKQAIVSYSVTCSVTNPLLVGTSTAMSYLEYSTNSGSTWLLPAQNGNSSGVGITVTLQLTNGQTGTLVGVIPANALVRLRTATTGTASVTYVTGTEIY